MVSLNKDNSEVVSYCSEADSCFNVDYSEKNTDNKEADKNVDGGWAWVVLAAATATFCIFGSSIKCFGVFFNGFVEEFDASSSLTALIPGVFQGTYSILTFPVLTVGLRYFSTRQFAIVTGILSSAAFIAGSFANKVEILLITNGFMTGMAFAFVHGPLTYLNGLYFIKRRNLAQAITVSGFSFGGCVLPSLYTYLIDKYGLRGGMLITGGMLLNIVVFALFLKPKHSTWTEPNKSDMNGKDVVIQNFNKNSHKFQTNWSLQKPMIEPLMRKERERSYSETVVKSEPVNHEISKTKMNTYFSDTNVYKEAHSGSIDQFINKLSHSNITRLLGESDVLSMSMSELHGGHYGSFDSLDSETSSKFMNKMKCAGSCSVLKNWFMWIYFFVYFFGSIGSAYVIIFIAPFAKDQNISPNKVASLVSIVNACDFLGRLLNGVITDRNILKNHQSIILTLSITTLCLALSPLYKQYWHFVLFAIVSGLSAGGIFALTPSVIADFLGVDNFRPAMAILVLGQGLSLGLSAPFIGYLRDVTGTYITSFYFMSACEFLAVTLFTVGLAVNRKLF